MDDDTYMAWREGEAKLNAEQLPRPYQNRLFRPSPLNQLIVSWSRYSPDQ